MDAFYFCIQVCNLNDNNVLYFPGGQGVPDGARAQSGPPLGAGDGSAGHPVPPAAPPSPRGQSGGEMRSHPQRFVLGEQRAGHHGPHAPQSFADGGEGVLLGRGRSSFFRRNLKQRWVTWFLGAKVDNEFLTNYVYPSQGPPTLIITHPHTDIVHCHQRGSLKGSFLVWNLISIGFFNFWRAFPPCFPPFFIFPANLCSLRNRGNYLY